MFEAFERVAALTEEQDLQACQPGRGCEHPVIGPFALVEIENLDIVRPELSKGLVRSRPAIPDIEAKHLAGRHIHIAADVAHNRLRADKHAVPETLMFRLRLDEKASAYRPVFWKVHQAGRTLRQGGSGRLRQRPAEQIP